MPEEDSKETGKELRGMGLQHRGTEGPRAVCGSLRLPQPPSLQHRPNASGHLSLLLCPRTVILIHVEIGVIFRAVA